MTNSQQFGFITEVDFRSVLGRPEVSDADVVQQLALDYGQYVHSLHRKRRALSRDSACEAKTNALTAQTRRKQKLLSQLQTTLAQLQLESERVPSEVSVPKIQRMLSTA